MTVTDEYARLHELEEALVARHGEPLGKLVIGIAMITSAGSEFDEHLCPACRKRLHLALKNIVTAGSKLSGKEPKEFCEEIDSLSRQYREAANRLADSR